MGMDKIFSARMDEAVIRKVGDLALALRKTKKAILEAAIQSYARDVQSQGKKDPLQETLGAWTREETPAETVDRARRSFRESMGRHHP
jgi:predicted transcriptional regulator